MADKEKYVIKIQGQLVEVPPEVYYAYFHMERQERRQGDEAEPGKRGEGAGGRRHKGRSEQRQRLCYSAGSYRQNHTGGVVDALRGKSQRRQCGLRSYI